MSRYFTHYWDNDTWREEQARGDEGYPVGEFYSNQFMDRGLGSADVVYIVTVRQGVLYVLCRLEVERVEPRGNPEGRWHETAIARRPTATPRHFDNQAPVEVTRDLHSISSAGVTDLKFTPDGKLDQQTLRIMRELRPESAALLDDVILRYEEALAQEHHDLTAL